MNPEKLLLPIVFVVGLTAALTLPESWLFEKGGMAMNAANDGIRWACPMFCVVMEELPDDKKCPVCGMDLGPISSSNRLSLQEREMIGLQTHSVSRRPLAYRLSLSGEVDFDESKMSSVTARAAGWVERLARKITWEEVEAGDVLLDFYSPEVLMAQEEYLVAAKNLSPELQKLAERRLELLGVSQDDIAYLKQSGEASRRIPVRSPRNGVIVRRNIMEGAQVKLGQEMMAIADLSTVWLQLQVFETELHQLQLDDEVQIARDADPGAARTTGRVVFMDPIVDRMTRTARVRIEVENTRVSDDRWRFLPGERVTCEVNIPVERGGEQVLALPRSSVLGTGKRHVIYALFEDKADGTKRFDFSQNRLPASLGFELVEVRIGPLAHDTSKETLAEYYPVLGVVSSGDPTRLAAITQGVVVATHGAFMLDSQSQLTGNASLRYPDGTRSASRASPHANH